MKIIKLNSLIKVASQEILQLLNTLSKDRNFLTVFNKHLVDLSSRVFNASDQLLTRPGMINDYLFGISASQKKALSSITYQQLVDMGLFSVGEVIAGQGEKIRSAYTDLVSFLSQFNFNTTVTGKVDINNLVNAINFLLENNLYEGVTSNITLNIPGINDATRQSLAQFGIQ